MIEGMENVRFSVQDRKETSRMRVLALSGSQVIPQGQNYAKLHMKYCAQSSGALSQSL